MAFGYTGKILVVDLTAGTVTIDEQNETFYRKYLGGIGFSAYYALKYIKPGVDPLGDDNVLIFAPGLLTGTLAPAVPRYTVTAKSPLTGAIGKSEAGGFWGPELKMAGFDALIVKGKAPKPVYLQIRDGVCEIVDAAHLWGLKTDECQAAIKSEFDKKARVAQIGPGGENQVLFANIVNELAHFNGRNGLGAVMGAKNLKAVAVRGTGKVDCFDGELVKDATRWVAKNMNDHPLAYGLHRSGTPGGLTTVNAGGLLPTRNWQENTFEGAEDISAESLETILVNRKGCYSCPIRCKRVVQVERDDFSVDPALGGPEYETLACLGSNLGIRDIALVSKANELCNKYTLDTISFGMTLSFAMECFEKGLLTVEDTGGLELTFNNNELLLPLIEMTALKVGFGAKLALGSARLAAEIGNGAEKLLLTVKKQEVPAHDPRGKSGVGMMYALSSHGADHWVAMHDTLYVEKGSIGLDSIAPLGIVDPVAALDLGERKVALFYYTHLMTMMYDCLGVCVFGYASRSVVSLEKTMALVKAVTGWDTSLWEMMKCGERASVMMRLFNAREGFDAKDDILPEKFYNNLSTGPLTGKNKMDRVAFADALNGYYQMAGLDENGHPVASKVSELGLGGFGENN
jgi:aldehyde:ferredoxin oxidoreductase